MEHENKSYDRVGDIGLDFANIWHVLTLNRHVQGYVLVCFIETESDVVVLWFMRWHVLCVSVKVFMERRTYDNESVKMDKASVTRIRYSILNGFIRTHQFFIIF